MLAGVLAAGCGKDEPAPKSTASTATAAAASAKGGTATTPVVAAPNPIAGDMHSMPRGKAHGDDDADDDDDDKGKDHDKDKDKSPQAVVRSLNKVARSWQRAALRLQRIDSNFVPPPDADKPGVLAALADIRARVTATQTRIADLSSRLGSDTGGATAPALDAVSDDEDGGSNNLQRRLSRISELLQKADQRLSRIADGFVPPPDADKPAERTALAQLGTQVTAVSTNAASIGRRLEAPTGR